MEFGKLKDISAVDFTLPNDPRGTTELLAKLPKRTGPPQVYFGATGWTMKQWVGTFYPPKTASKDYQLHYCKQFNTIEFNTTHYRIPNSEMVAKWKGNASAGFKFSPKIPQSISHSDSLGTGTGYTKLFCEQIQALGDKLGVSFMQLPPNFTAAKMALLRKYLTRFPLDKVPLAVELRNEGWFNNSYNFGNVFSMLEELGVSSVITDVSGRRDVLHMRLTSPVAMVRFVGNGLHQTDYERINAWVDRLKTWIDSGLQTVYFFLHQPDNILSPDMTVYFVERMNKVCGLNLRAPKKHEDPQISLF